MPDNQRIDDLRRRVQKDPASIAFAQLAEELRRAGEMQEAVDTCRAGLAIHPTYLSARVTLGRSLVELERLDEAADELAIVLKSAPENLAAMRAMAEVLQRRGQLGEALTQYRVALTHARNDPELEETVADLSRKLEPKPAAASADGLSQTEFLSQLPGAALLRAAQSVPVSAFTPEPEPEPTPFVPVEAAAPEPVPDVPDGAVAAAPDVDLPGASAVARSTDPEPAPTPEPSAPVVDPQEEIERDRASRTVVALEHWLDAIHDARAERRA
jgi:tetratricopeptide (TPR) repeat protein